MVKSWFLSAVSPNVELAVQTNVIINSRCSISAFYLSIQVKFLSKKPKPLLLFQSRQKSSLTFDSMEHQRRTNKSVVRCCQHREASKLRGSMSVLQYF